MYRKYVAPLDKRTIQNLMKYYTKDAGQSEDVADFEFYLGQLYKFGIVQITKQLENKSFTFFISLTEAGKDLLKQRKFLMQTAL
jgi:hypothetical protein